MPPDDIIDHLHDGHQGIAKCLERARSSVWWPGITTQIKHKVSTCVACCRESVTRREPLIVTDFPERPWQVVATDLFFLGGYEYLIVIDYYSRYIEMAKLSSSSSEQIITHLKSIFARHGIPEVLRSDNGPQYASREFASFARDYNFEHVTSSPH